MLEQYFLRPDWLWATLAVIPVIILYLIRPRPKKQVIPSLMFVSHARKKSLTNALFRYLMRDVLLWMHILIILLLALLLAQPYLSVPFTAAADATVIVLDDSASMYTSEDGTLRYERAKSFARDALSSKNTIILAGSIPTIALEEVSARRARQFLDEWKPTHQTTKLSPALVQAQTFAGKQSTRVVLISDLADTDDSQDYANAIKTLEALGMMVDVKQVATKQTYDNVGIVDIDVSEIATTAKVHNFGEDAKTVTLCADDNCLDAVVSAQETYAWDVVPKTGITELVISQEDDLAIDNTLYLSMPEENFFDVLVVSNGDFFSSYLYFALDSIARATPVNFSYTINEPPALVDVNHDLVIFYDVDPQYLVGRVVRETIAQTADGGAVIVHTQDNIADLDYQQLFPYEVLEEQGFSSVVNVAPYAQLSQIGFGSTQQHTPFQPQTQVVALAQTEDQNPVVSVHPVGRGNVLVYGIHEVHGSFTNAAEYPLFWKHAIDILLNRARPEELNKQTGERLAQNAEVLGPDGLALASPGVLDFVGVYKAPQQSYTANLLSFQESNIIPGEKRSTQADVALDTEDLLVEQEFTLHIISLIILLLFLELLYIKWRGDI